MVKNKKEEEEDYSYIGLPDEEELDDFSDLEEDINEDDNISDEELKKILEDDIGADNDLGFSDNESLTHPLSLASYINKQSEQAKYYKELPLETKYSFYDTEEKQQVKHFSKAYNDHKYIEKIIDIRTIEDTKNTKAKMNIKEVKDLETLKQYFINIKRDYLINDIEDLTPEEILLVIKRIKEIKPNYMLNHIENQKQNIEDVYNEFEETNETPKYIDDMGNSSRIISTSIASMGYKGNASQHSIMSINAVKNEDITRDMEQKKSFSLLDTIKRKFTNN